MSTVCSTKVLRPQNLFLNKDKGRMSRYVVIRHLCFSCTYCDYTVD